MLVSKRFFLSRVKMLGFLDELELDTDMVKSLYIPFGLALTDVETLLEQEFKPRATTPELVKLAASSKTGAVLFLGSLRNYLILPP
ncbi:hypothetical protein ACFLTZ_04325, partial [Chloroflexota bacterium]